MVPAGEFTKEGLLSGKLEFFMANFKLKDVSTYHAGATLVCHIYLFLEDSMIGRNRGSFPLSYS